MKPEQAAAEVQSTACRRGATELGLTTCQINSRIARSCACRPYRLPCVLCTWFYLPCSAHELKLPKHRSIKAAGHHFFDFRLVPRNDVHCFPWIYPYGGVIAIAPVCSLTLFSNRYSKRNNNEIFSFLAFRILTPDEVSRASPEGPTQDFPIGDSFRTLL